MVGSIRSIRCLTRAPGGRVGASNTSANSRSNADNCWCYASEPGARSTLLSATALQVPVDPVNRPTHAWSAGITPLCKSRTKRLQETTSTRGVWVTAPAEFSLPSCGTPRPYTQTTSPSCSQTTRYKAQSMAGWTRFNQGMPKIASMASGTTQKSQCYTIPGAKRKGTARANPLHGRNSPSAIRTDSVTPVSTHKLAA